MKTLWAPWRLEYIRGARMKGCLLCKKPKERDDRRNYILLRSRRTFVMLNAYPYNNGHLLISPYRHVPSLENLDGATLAEMMRITNRSLAAIRKAFSPDGINIGVNIGKMAGAGIAGHVHIHLVPRWSGDTNFMSVFAETRVLPQHLASTYDDLAPYFGRGR